MISSGIFMILRVHTRLGRIAICNLKEHPNSHYYISNSNTSAYSIEINKGYGCSYRES